MVTKYQWFFFHLPLFWWLHRCFFLGFFTFLFFLHTWHDITWHSIIQRIGSFGGTFFKTGKIYSYGVTYLLNEIAIPFRLIQWMIKMMYVCMYVWYIKNSVGTFGILSKKSNLKYLCQLAIFECVAHICLEN